MGCSLKHEENYVKHDTKQEKTSGNSRSFHFDLACYLLDRYEDLFCRRAEYELSSYRHGNGSSHAYSDKDSGTVVSVRAV